MCQKTTSLTYETQSRPEFEDGKCNSFGLKIKALNI